MEIAEPAHQISHVACCRPAFMSPFAATAPSATEATDALSSSAIAPAAAQPSFSADASGTAPRSARQLFGQITGPADVAPPIASSSGSGVRAPSVGLPRARLAARSLPSPFADPVPADPPLPLESAADPSLAQLAEPAQIPQPLHIIAVPVAVDTDSEIAAGRGLSGGLLGLPMLVSFFQCAASLRNINVLPPGKPIGPAPFKHRLALMVSAVGTSANSGFACGASEQADDK